MHDKADAGLRDAMDSAYLTDQRVTDSRLMEERDVREGQIWVLQEKKAKRRIEVIGELKVLIDRIMNRKSAHKVRSTRLMVSEDGTPMTRAMLRRRFGMAREAAGVAKPEFQMRDLRANAGTPSRHPADRTHSQTPLQSVGANRALLTLCCLQRRHLQQ